jgi:adenylosuccinate synthase
MNQTCVVVGASWGDEGKGKIVDLLSSEHDIIVRFQGGNNAGHTLVVKDQKIILHTIPSGALYDDKINVIGNGVVLDPKVCIDEINGLKSMGYLTKEENLKISSRVNFIMPYHCELDKASEKKLKNKIGTTGRGIGPAYSDKVARKGIRFCDVLYSPEEFKEKLKDNLEEKNFLLKKFYGQKEVEINEVYENYIEYAQVLRPYICDTSLLIDSAIKCGKKILFEGAQGILLDIDHGTYPFVTSSNTVAGSVFAGSPIAASFVNRVMGIAKAYSTRVGEGPFPTELNDDAGKKLRDVGHEFGATTGRPRRCGWIDLVALKYASIVSGITEITLTKLDVLSNIGKLKLCVSYKVDDKIIDSFPPTGDILSRSEPVYQEMEGWDEDISGMREFKDLPENAKKYINLIEDFLKVKVSMLSVSPAREAVIKREI